MSGKRAANGRLEARSLHLVDLENIVGNPRGSLPESRVAIDRYTARARIGGTDLVVVAFNHGWAKEVLFDIDPAWRVCLASGRDGADEALIQAAPAQWVATRFGRLVIGSGDHAFTRRANEVRSLGVEVHVIARSRSLSRDLRAEADELDLIPATCDHTRALPRLTPLVSSQRRGTSERPLTTV